VVKEGKLEIVPSFYLTMNFDRRVMAGGPAARLFNRIVELLENPAALI
jgi:pyruvate/2-oxoglutarate dehydrogenase complex dihydrolipoamide acyltransferase (E2) component